MSSGSTSAARPPRRHRSLQARWASSRFHDGSACPSVRRRLVEHVWPDQRGENDSAQPRSQHPRPQLAVDATRDGVLHCTSTHVASQRETAAWSDMPVASRPTCGRPGRDGRFILPTSRCDGEAFATLLATMPSAQEPASTASLYRLSYEQNGGDWVSIDMSWAPALPAETALVMPRAIPMGYGEQRCDSFVADVRAFTSAGPGKRCRTRRGSALALTSRHAAYQLPRGSSPDGARYPPRLGCLTRARRVSQRAGLFSVCLRRRLRIARCGPRVEAPAGWPVFSTLAPRVPAATISVEARAADYYALADAQIVMGPRRRSGGSRYAGAALSSGVRRNRRSISIATAVSPSPPSSVSSPTSVAFRSSTTRCSRSCSRRSRRSTVGMSMEHLDSSTYYLSVAAALTTDSPDAELRCSTTSPITSAIRGCRSGPTDLGTSVPMGDRASARHDLVCRGLWPIRGDHGDRGRHAEPGGVPRKHPGDALPAKHHNGPPFLKRLPLVELSRIAPRDTPRTFARDDSSSRAAD